MFPSDLFLTQYRRLGIGTGAHSNIPSRRGLTWSTFSSDFNKTLSLRKIIAAEISHCMAVEDEAGAITGSDVACGPLEALE